MDEHDGFADLLECVLYKVSDTGWLASGDHKVFGLIVLQNVPHRLKKYSFKYFVIVNNEI
jgi:hypothetical protein